MFCVPDIFTNQPDEFEGKDLQFTIKYLLIKDISNIGWTVNKNRINFESIMRVYTIPEIPLIIVEENENGYELIDGQHRFAAYHNVFPNQTYIKVAF